MIMIISPLKISYTKFSKFSSDNYGNKVFFGALLVQDCVSSIKNIGNPINVFKNFSVEEYSKLSDVQLNILRNQYNSISGKLNLDTVRGIDAFCNIISECMKLTLDKSFGKNNYIVVPVGRSLSTISKFLSYKIGEENVKNIPLSDAYRFKFDENDFCEFVKVYKNIEKDKGLKRFLKYLNKNGLSKDDIQKSSKHIILTDYCCTGASLKGAKALLQSNFVWGNQKNVHSIDVSKFTKVIEPEIVNIPYLHSKFKDSSYGICDIDRMLFQWFFDGSFKPFSLISSCTSLSSIIKSSKNHNLGNNEKLVLFKLLDDFMTGKKSFKFNPKLKNKQEIPYSKNQKIQFWNNKNQQLTDDKYDDILWINNVLMKTLQLEKSGALDTNFSTRIIKNLTAVKNKYFKNNDISQNNAEKYYKARQRIHQYLNNIEKQFNKCLENLNYSSCV